MEGLYLITCENEKYSHYTIAKKAIGAGVGIIQYREKNKDYKTRFEEALKIKRLCDQNKVIFFVNDDVHLALVLNSNLHLGQGDLPIERARQILGKKKIIGLSATNYEEALEGQVRGADYLGVGPIFETPSKADAAPPIGLEKLKKICDKITIPVFAIGGITSKNVRSVYDAGVDGVAVISAICNEKDIERAIEELT